MILFLVISTIFSWIMVVVLFLGMLSQPSEIKSLWFLWLLLIAFGILAGNHAVWELIGKVRITITDDSIQISNVWTLFKKDLTIPLSEFRGITFKKEEATYFFTMYNIGKGDIVIRYKNGERRFGRGMSKHKSLILIKDIEHEISNRKGV